MVELFAKSQLKVIKIEKHTESEESPVSSSCEWCSSDGFRTLQEGSGCLHPAEGAGLERARPPPSDLHRGLTLPPVFE